MSFAYYQRLSPEKKAAYKARVRAWALANPDKRKKIARKYAKANPEIHRGDPDKARARSRAYRARNPDTWKKGLDIEKARARLRRWKKLNPNKSAADSAERRVAKIMATPAWANKRAIRAIYREAARATIESGVQHHVDHIIPLRSEIVCGLHVHINLQVITAAENIEKSNKLLEAA